MKKIQVFSADDWHEEKGNCLFLHFDDFESPPITIMTTPTSSDFEELEEGYWTHFIILDWNNIFDQAQQLNFSNTDYDVGN